MLALMMAIESPEERLTFQNLYEKTKGLFVGIAYKILEDYSEAEAVVHDVYAKIADDYHKYRNKPIDEMKRLGAVMTKNRCYNVLKKKKHIVDMPNNEYMDTAIIGKEDLLEDIINEERYEELKSALRALTEEEYAILMMRYDIRCSYRDIAKEMGTSVNNIKMRLYRIKKKLREVLEDEQI